MSEVTFQKNPWQDAKRIHDDRIGDAYVRAYNWRILAILTSIIALVAVVGMLLIAMQKKYIPYVVEVDKLGRAAMVEFIEKAKPVDARIIKAYLGRFMTDFRSVILDPIPEKAAIDRVYSMVSVGTPAFNKLNAFFRDNSPFVRSKIGGVEVEIISILQISPKVWEVEWSENARNLQGEVAKVTRWKASMTTAISHPQQEDEMLINPLGVFVFDLSWTRQL